jgi:HEAT repeat protein
MGARDQDLQALIDQLSHASSGKRRQAARRLRGLRHPAAGPPLLEALRRELNDPRTWETQYQMIMALGECQYQKALPLLRDLASQPLFHSMVLVAVGDALLRLSRRAPDDPAPLLEIMSTAKAPVIEGALRAVAMLRLKLDDHAVRTIIQYASKPENEPRRFWVAAAAPGWRGLDVEDFLHQCSQSGSEETRRAAAAALKGQYLKWNPL